jgi:hypothetical protein
MRYVNQSDGIPTGKYYLLVQCEVTSMNWSLFLDNKSIQAEILLGFIKKLQGPSSN